MNSSVRRLAALALLGLVASACNSAGSATNSSAPGVSKAADAALAKLQGQVLSKGPNGEAASPASTADLTAADVAKVKAMGATAAIALHYGGNDWSNAQVDGLKSEFGRLGIKVLAVTDADFKPNQQVSDLETILSRKPKILVSIPTDPVATATEYKKVAQAGVKIVFMDNSPKGMVPGKDYVSVVSADNYGNGVVSAHLMAKALGGKGTIGLIHHEADFFVTKQRYQGFEKTIKDDYPNIKIVADKGIAGPDFAGDAQGAANAILSQHPDLNGIWAVWDVPAEGVLAAVRSSGRNDVKVGTQDLGKNVAIALAKNQLVVGLGAQVPYDQGVTEARLAAKSLLGQKTPPYVALSALPVQHANVLDAWDKVYHQKAPAFLTSSFKK